MKRMKQKERKAERTEAKDHFVSKTVAPFAGPWLAEGAADRKCWSRVDKTGFLIGRFRVYCAADYPFCLSWFSSMNRVLRSRPGTFYRTGTIVSQSKTASEIVFVGCFISSFPLLGRRLFSCLPSFTGFHSWWRIFFDRPRGWDAVALSLKESQVVLLQISFLNRCEKRLMQHQASKTQ